MIAGPNVANESDAFFQSDRDVVSSQKKLVKQSKYAKAGSPLSFPSKVLHFVILGDCIYTAESGHVARESNLETGKTKRVFRGHSGPVTCLQVYSLNGKPTYLFTGSWDKTVCQWDLEDGSLMNSYTGHGDFVKEIILFGNFLLTCSTDKTIRKFVIGHSTASVLFQGHGRSVESMVLSPDGLVLYSGSSDTTIRKWDVKTGACLSVLEGHLTSVYGLILDPDSDSLWSTSADKTCKRWDLETEKCELTLEHPDFVICAALLDGSLVATGCRDELVRVFDMASEKCVLTITGHFDTISSLWYSQGKLWSASLDNTVRQWNIRELMATTLTELKEEEEEEEQVDDVNMMTAEEEAELADLL